MKSSECAPILNKIQAQFRALGLFFDDATLSVYSDTLAPHDAVIAGQIVDAYLQRNPRQVMTPPELEQAIRDAKKRASVWRSDADKYHEGTKLSPEVAKRALREGFERDWKSRHGNEPIPAEAEQLFKTVSSSIDAGPPHRRQADKGGK